MKKLIALLLSLAVIIGVVPITVSASAATTVSISSQPKNYTGNIGDTAAFSVTVKNGTGAKYQWQYSTNSGKTWTNASVTGAKTAKASVAVTAARLKCLYRCKITPKTGKVIYTKSVKIVLSPLTISKQPVNFTGPSGNTATFRVTVKNGKGVTYQWQYSANSGKKWVNATATGAKTAKISVKITTTTLKNLYRCKMTDAAGKVYYTNSVKLVLDKMAISKQPVDFGGVLNSTATYSVTVSNGTGASYQWQYSTDSGKKWVNLTTDSAKTSKLNVKITSTNAKRIYRCKITSKYSKVVYTNSVKMIVDKMAISKQPVDYTGVIGSKAAFTVTVSNGTGASYQWQYSANSGKTWKNTSTTGYNTAKFSVAATEARENYLYRCMITSAYGKIVYTDSVKMILDKLTVSKQPADVHGKIGDTATFSVEVEKAEAQSYQWQQSSDGGDNWSDCTVAGSDTASIGVIISEAKADNFYRCKITSAYGRIIYTDSVKMIPDLLSVSEQPVSVGGKAGDKVIFSVATENGEVGSYKWQYSSDKGKTWKDFTCEGADTASITVAISEENDKNIYRCEITSVYGKVIYSDDVVAVQDKLAISKQPANYNGLMGKTATFTVETSDGEVGSYQWQYTDDEGKTWKDCTDRSGKTSILLAEITETTENYFYRCKVTSIYGKEITSGYVAIIVDRLAISKQPEDFHGEVGKIATLTVEVENGEPVSYLWQQSSDSGDNWTDCTSEGYNTATLSEVITEGKAYNLYRCKIVTVSGNVLYSEPSVKIIPDLLVVSKQPVDVAGVIGTMAVFTVETESGTVGSYCWQESEDDGTNWTDCTLEGADTASITVEITDENAAKVYRCVITSNYNKVINSYNVKVLADKLEISEQPVDYTGLMDADATFTVETAGGTDETYHWQSLTEGDTEWRDAESDVTDEATLTVKITEENENRIYRCVVTSKYGREIISDSVKLISDKLAIATQPANVFGEVGRAVSFTVATEKGEVETYQWQVFTAEETGWTDCTLEGSKTATLPVVITEEDAVNLYRCVITSKYGKVLTTDSVKMIPDLLEISEQPVSVTGIAGSTAKFTVATSQDIGRGIVGTYMWQASSDGKNWNDVSFEGYNTATVSIQISEATSKFEYRCLVTSMYGKELYTDSVKINLDALCISKQPANMSGYPDDTVTATVETADGTVETYQWQSSADGDNWDDIEDATTDTLSITANEENAARVYRCHIVSIYGKVLNTDTVTLTVLCRHENLITDTAVAATCTTDGKTEGSHCADCEAVLVAQEVIPALGHHMVDVEALEPGCLDGHTAYSYCDREGCDYKEGYEVIPATGTHKYTSETVAATGVTRGHTLYTCSMCGNTYKTGPYDFGLYEGVNFTSANKFLIPYNFNSTVYTIEASVNVPTATEGAAGVIVGNYNGLNSCFNLEIAEGGLVRLYFKIVADGAENIYDYTFTKDIRSDGVVSIAVTIEKGSASLYVDGEFAETVALGDFDIPQPRRAFVLGGDCRTGNTKAFKGTVYSLAVFRDIRTAEEIVNDIALADVNDADYCTGYNIIDSDSLTGGASVNDPFEYMAVSTADDLEYYASIGTKNIEITGDIVLDRTVYVMGEVNIYADENHTITRDPAFAGDMFVVGTNSVNRNLVLDSIECRLTLGKAGAGTLTIDGNKANTTVDVHGALVYAVNSGFLTVNDGAVLTNNKKVANSRSLAVEQFFANLAGGAAIVSIDGSVTVNGGAITNNEVNSDDLSGGDWNAANYLQSCYGGAIFNAGDLTVNGGIISGNTGYYGGAIANLRYCKITKGTLKDNSASHAGGALYNYNGQYVKAYLGIKDGNLTDLTFENNSSTTSSGGGVYSGEKCSLLIYGGITFKGNSAKSNGGAVHIGGYGEILSNAEFTGNSANGSGGAIYVVYNSADTNADAIRQCTFTGITAKDNTAGNGGAIGIESGLVDISDSTLTDNTAKYKGGAIYTNDKVEGEGADVSIDNVTITGNSATEAGAVFGDRACVIDITDSHINGNSTTTGNGGAISLHGSALTVGGCEIDSNTAAGTAGAIYVSYRTVEVAVEQTEETTTDEQSEGTEAGEQTPETTEVYYDSTVVIKNSTVSNNTATEIGGAICIYCKDSATESLNCENVTFSKNTAGTTGGAILASGVVSFTGCTFAENSAANGGAVHTSSKTVTFDDCYFTGNTSTAEGGAIYLKGIVTATDCNFSKNTAGTNGGAIAVYNDGKSLTVNGSTFSENVSTGNGGAIYVNKAALTGSGNKFTSNVGNKTAYGGGAVYTTGGTVTLTASEFTGNDANFGGALACYSDGNVTLTDTVATGNTAVSGGLAYVKNSTLTVNNTETGTTKVTGNTSSSGGSVIYGDVNSVILVDGATVKDNASTGSGGAFYVIGGNTSMTVKNCTISDNIGKYGCALLAYGGNAEFIGCTISGHNAISGFGGAFYIRENSKATVFADVTAENCIFTGNSSTGTNGGAVYIKAGTTFTAKDCRFAENTTDKEGGAIYSVGTLNLNGGTFSNNSALNGGAVKIENSAATVTGTTFTGNTASESYGGAIYALGVSDTRSTLTMADINCNGNRTPANGAAIYLAYCDATIDGGNVSGNTSNSNAGGIGVTNYSVLTINSLTATNNTANLGGVFYVNRSTLNLVESEEGDEILFGTTDSTKAEESANTASATGGVIYATIGATVNVNGATFGYNKATTYGGAVAGTHASGSVIAITNSEFSGNSSKNGGAIYGELATVIDVESSTFTENVATTSGGAVYLKGSADMDVEASTFTGNVATTSGGAVYMKDSADFDDVNSVFTSNTAKDGGAAYIYTDATNTVSFTETKFEANAVSGNTGSSLSRGGAVYSSMGCKTEYTDVTLKNNTSTGKGAGICATYASDDDGNKLTPNIIINSLTIDQASGIPVQIASAQVHGTVTTAGVVDVNNAEATVSGNLIKGTLTNITFN